jgi:hypothetical protein
MFNEQNGSSGIRIFPDFRAFGAAILVMLLAGCNDNGLSGSGGTGTISGTVTDSGGAPVGGATVVAGNSSPATITDRDGNFTLTGIPAGPVAVKTFAAGYVANSFSLNVSNNATTAVPAPIRIVDVDDVANAPQIANAAAQIAGAVISATATIRPGASGSAISDARAELVGYGIGGVMTASGAGYSASFNLPSDFVGPSALIEIFAIDDKGRVGIAVATLQVSSPPVSGSFNDASIAGNWAGSLAFHRAAFGGGDRAGDRRISNVSLSILGIDVSGKIASILIESVLPTAQWSVVTADFTGTLTLIDATLGFYKIAGSFDLGTATVDVILVGKLDAAANPSSFVGLFEATLGGPIGTRIAGHFRLVKDLSWAAGDLDGNWVWSEFIKQSSPDITTYQAPFQYNSAFPVVSGAISTLPDTDTLGNTLTPLNSFSVSDPSLGIFSVTVRSIEDGSTVDFSGLIGPAKEDVNGLFHVSLAGRDAYGPFWGTKVAIPPHYATEDFGQKRSDGSTGIAIWRGFYSVSAGPDACAACFLSLRTDATGSVVGGTIRSLTGICPLVNFTSGSLSFSNTANGQITGSATGGITTFTFAPTGFRNASMGVAKARLAGDFSLNRPGGSDTGFFFLQRTFIE